MASPSYGVAEQRFPQTYAIRIACAIGLLGSAALFTFIAQGTKGEEEWKSLLYGIAIAEVIACIAIWVVIARTSLVIDQMGVKRESIFGTRAILWGDISETRYQVTPINAAGHFGLIGLLISSLSSSSKANLTLRLRSRDGKEVKITSNFRNAKDAMSIILGRVLPPMISEAKSRIERGEKVEFGPVSLTRTELFWKDKPLPLNEIAKAEINGSKLRVKRTGKWLDFIAVRTEKVPNVLALLELLDTLAPQLKANGIDPLARVRL